MLKSKLILDLRQSALAVLGIMVVSCGASSKPSKSIPLAGRRKLQNHFILQSHLASVVRRSPWPLRSCGLPSFLTCPSSSATVSATLTAAVVSPGGRWGIEGGGGLICRQNRLSAFHILMFMNQFPFFRVFWVHEYRDLWPKK